MWLPEDRDAIVVWQEEQRTQCSCGTWPWQWEDNPDAWHADFVICEGHKRLETLRDRVMGSPGNHAGAQFRLYRFPRGEEPDAF